MSKLLISPQYTPETGKKQKNALFANPRFKKITAILRRTDITRSDSLELHNAIKSLVASENGKFVVRLIVSLNLTHHPYSYLAKLVGFTREQVRQWVKEHSPLLFEEKRRKAGDERD